MFTQLTIVSLKFYQLNLSVRGTKQRVANTLFLFILQAQTTDEQSRA